MDLNNILKIEKNGLLNLNKILSDNNIKGKFLLITSTKVKELYGECIEKQLKSLGHVDIIYFGDNSIKNSMEISKKLIEQDYDYAIGMGGGKVLDTTKYAAYISKKDFIAIPTTLANDGIASPIAVLKTDSGKVKSLGSKSARVIIIDTAIMLESPIELIKAGIGDTISNYMALIDWKLACEKGKDKMNDVAYLMSLESMDALMNTKYIKIDENFIKVLANSIILSGIAMQLAGSSRPVSGSEHLFSHAIDYYYCKNNLHGLQVALGTIAMLKVLNKDYHNILEYLKKFEVNINPESLNLNEEEFIFCMKQAIKMRTNRYTHLNEIKLQDKKLKKIYYELLEEL